ncbi:hypothetical protein MD484_g7681, partial [Candolleomyces efflorescens]
MRIKYTTYNARRDEDIVHVETDRCNVMLLNPEYSRGSPLHPFRYAKVIGILHAEVGHAGSIGLRGPTDKYHSIEFLWVRWYQVSPAPVTDLELDRAELLPLSHPESLAFIDPNEVLRACHIIPCFRSGKRYPDGIGTSKIAEDGTDWNQYFINRFVDRDMFMRYEWGLAVGHLYTHRDAVAAYRDIVEKSNAVHEEDLSVRGDVGSDGLPSLQQECSQDEDDGEGKQEQEAGGKEDEEKGEDEDEEADVEDDESEEDSDQDSDDEHDRRVESEDEKEIFMFGTD